MNKTSTPTSTASASTDHELTRTAGLLVDFENVAIPLDKKVAYIINVTRGIMQWLKTSQQCQIGESHAFADWRDYPRSKEALNGLGINCHQVDKNPGKNGADIALAMEAQRIFSEQPEIDPLLLITGDADFLPLLQSAQIYNRKVLLASCPKELSAFLLQVQGLGNTVIIMGEGFVFPLHEIEMMVLSAALQEYLAVRPQYPSVRVDLFMKTQITGLLEDIYQEKREVTISTPHVFNIILDSLARQGYIKKWNQVSAYVINEVFAPNMENTHTRQLLKELE